MCYGGTFTFVFDVDKRLRGPENSTSPGALFHCREKGGDMSPQGGPFPLLPPTIVYEPNKERQYIKILEKDSRQNCSRQLLTNSMQRFL